MRTKQIMIAATIAATAAFATINTTATTAAPQAAAQADAASFTGTKYTYKRISIAPPVKKINDETIPAGRTKVANPGKPGVKKLTFRERYVNGKLITVRYINVRITVKPQPKIVKIGIKGMAASRGGWVRIPSNVNTAMFRKAMIWADTSDVERVRQCEASGNYKLQDPPYYGAYQFLTSTWRSMGGGVFASRADYAPRWAQDYVAYKLYVSQGWRPWTCARIVGII
jgi:hypothetical protein